MMWIKNQIPEDMWLPCELVGRQDHSPLALNLVLYVTFSNPVIHPGNYYTMQQNMLLWHFQKENARRDGCLMFHKMAFMCYIVYFYSYC